MQDFQDLLKEKLFTEAVKADVKYELYDQMENFQAAYSQWQQEVKQAAAQFEGQLNAIWDQFDSLRKYVNDNAEGTRSLQKIEKGAQVQVGRGKSASKRHLMQHNKAVLNELIQGMEKYFQDVFDNIKYAIASPGESRGGPKVEVPERFKRKREKAKGNPAQKGLFDDLGDVEPTGEIPQRPAAPEPEAATAMPNQPSSPAHHIQLTPEEKDEWIRKRAWHLSHTRGNQLSQDDIWHIATREIDNYINFINSGGDIKQWKWQEWRTQMPTFHEWVAKMSLLK
jgi:hypothetical protein